MAACRFPRWFSSRRDLTSSGTGSGDGRQQHAELELQTILAADEAGRRLHAHGLSLEVGVFDVERRDVGVDQAVGDAAPDEELVLVALDGPLMALDLLAQRQGVSLGRTLGLQTAVQVFHQRSQAADVVLVVEDLLEHAKVQGAHGVEVVEVGFDRPQQRAAPQEGDLAAGDHTGTSSAAMGSGSAWPQNLAAART